MTPLEQMHQMAKVESIRARDVWDEGDQSPPKLTREVCVAHSHMTITAAARFIGVTQAAVSHAAKRHGISFATARDRYARLTHLTQIEAADRLGVSVSAVCGMAKRRGLHFKPCKWGPKS